ncbi:type IV secretion protein Rhs [Streptomyces sp. RB6PN25]|uniref:Type IV secretion protein Rhs n=1 Tax=Streptomyces humicola TaxID=2953240 RepID=A0ABT1Q236_9ACTN|nr:type IV secretion protein Rhs [Streptomyces humicola]
MPLQFTYDHVGRVTSWTDRNGTIYTYTYDTQGRCIRGEGSNGYQSGTFVYDDANRTTHITNALGHTTTVVYNEAYRPISETDPLGNTTLTEWDADNRLITAITDPLGRTTQNAYDDAGNPTTILRADGSVTDITYNALGLITSVTEPDGAIWRYEHDDRGNRTLVVDPSGSMTKYEYDGHGRPMTVTDALGHTHRIATNNAGLPTAVTDPLGRTTTLERDAFGRLTEMTDPLGHRICHGWTPEGRLSWREAADGSRETWAWDGEGNLTAHTDAAGNTNLYTYSYFDLLASHTTPDGTTYRFTYDAELHLTSVVNPQGRTWSYEYDPAGHLVAETDFNGRRLTYVHDAAGQLVRRTNGAGETVTYQRDLLGRTIERRGGSHSETFQYDSAGRLLRAANNAATVAFEHDQLGRVLTESVNGRQSSYEYDLLGRRTSRQLPSGAVSQWTYDAAGQPTALSVGGHTLTFDYDAAGRETHRRLDHGIRLVQEWNPVDRLISQTLETEGAGEAEARLQHRTYDYREDGFLTEIRELNSGTRRFDVNRGGQVTAVHARDWSETYAYDSAGNLSRASVPESSIGDEREFEGTLIRRTTKCRYDHDDQGRLIRATKRLLNGQVRIWSYTWDVNDRLTDVVTPDGTHWHYVYDPLGRRLSKQRLQPDGSHAESTSFIWDGTRVTEQIQATGQTTTWDYALDDHRPLYQIDHDPTQADYDARFYAIVTDLVGAPAELVGSDGRIAWQQRSTLWGSTAPSASSQSEVDCPLRFPGQYHDPETGWNYNYFRHYDPDTARYATPDPLGLEPADNDYAYVSNPLFWFDPLGLGACPRTASAAQLQDFYQQAEKYGKGGIRDLESGRIRFYGEVSLARNPGEMIGRRLVREWDPMTGNKRIWHETLDNEGNVRIVRPDVNVTGGKKVHYMFDKDGKFTGTF